MNLYSKALTCAACLVFGMTSSWAATYQGTVQDVTPYNGKVYVIIGAGAFDWGSACAAGANMVYWIDPSTPFGRALVAVAISAKISGRLVWTISDGTCVAGSPFNVQSEGLVGMDLKG